MTTQQFPRSHPRRRPSQSSPMSPTTTDPDDKSNFAPKHTGPNIFPNFFFFSRLVRLAHKQHLLAVRDVTFNYTATYQQLVTDVLYFRNVLYQTLSPSIRAKLDRDEEVFVNLLGPGGYEFTVAFLALMALGAVIVPISVDLPVKEAVYFATKSQSVAVVTAASCQPLAHELRTAMDPLTPDFKCIPITPHLLRKPLPLSQMLVSSDAYLDLNKSGLVIFTSGTTGPPKGGVKRRGFFYDVATMFGDQYDMREGDSVLHVLPVHHATGVTLTLLPFLHAGGCIEFRSGGFDLAWTWERIRKADLDFFSGVPTIYMRLMAYFESEILKKKSKKEVDEYVRGARRVRNMLCGTSALPRPLQEKWTKLRDGHPILTRYGGTEFGNAYSVSPWLENVPDGSVGMKMAGVDMKLKSEPEGEVLMRSPIMFSKYLFDATATKEALDDQGYFKTGDIARREGDFYFILGRESVDIIKSGGYKISALDIEREALGLEYISEVMVVGVEDEEYGQRVAAAVVLKPEFVGDGLTLKRLRGDLREVLAGYKMPTLLRVVKELKKNSTGKVIKKVLVGECFPKEEHEEVQRWGGRKREAKL